MLVPVDLLLHASAPNVFPQAPHDDVAARFAKADKLTILATQMTWVLGNLTDCHPVEIFSASLRTPAPVTALKPADRDNVPEEAEDVEGALPRTLEAWIAAQWADSTFVDLLDTIDEKALKNDLWIHAPALQTPSIIVPHTFHEALIRDTHERMFHLNHTKVHAVLKRSYFWPDLQKDTRRILSDCPECELTKARQHTAHAMFHAATIYAPPLPMVHGLPGSGHRPDR
jgi:hypothetical protein